MTVQQYQAGLAELQQINSEIAAIRSQVTAKQSQPLPMMSAHEPTAVQGGANISLSGKQVKQPTLHSLSDLANVVVGEPEKQGTLENIARDAAVTIASLSPVGVSMLVEQLQSDPLGTLGGMAKSIAETYDRFFKAGMLHDPIAQQELGKVLSQRPASELLSLAMPLGLAMGGKAIAGKIKGKTPAAMPEVKPIPLEPQPAPVEAKPVTPPVEAAKPEVPSEPPTKPVGESTPEKIVLGAKDEGLKAIEKKQAAIDAGKAAGSIDKAIEENLASAPPKDVQLGAGFNPLGRSKVTRSLGKLPEESGKTALDTYLESDKYKRPSLFKRTKEGLRQRFVQFADLKGKDASPASEGLSKNEFFADAVEWLRQTTDAPRVAATKSLSAVRGITAGLNHSQLNLLRKRIVTEDLLETARRGEATPEGFDIDLANQQLPQWQTTIDANPILRRAYDAHRNLMKAVQDDLIQRGKISEADAREFYFPHEVIEHAGKYGLGVRGKLKTPQRGYTKAREGSKLDINTDYLDVTYRHLSKVIRDNIIDDAIAKVGERYNRPEVEQMIKEYAQSVKDGMPDQDLYQQIKESGIVDWQPETGNRMFRAKTVTDMKVQEAIDDALAAAAESLDLDPKVFRDMLVLGGKKKTYYIPEELAKSLDTYRSDFFQAPGLLARTTGAFKQVVLNKNPIRYNRRNFIGDFERAANAVPEILTPESYRLFTKETLPEIRDALKGKFSDDYQKALDRGVVSGGEVAYEIGEVKNMPEFSHLDPRAKWRHLLRYAGTELRDLSITRENLLRYHVFKMNLKRIADGRSLLEGIAEIKGVTDPIDAAAKISREILGDYGKFTSWEIKRLRQGLLPFYSWLKINTTFWPKLVDKGFSAKGLAVSTPIRVARAASVVAKAAALYTVVDVWNNTVQREQEERLPIGQRKRFHVNTGIVSDGKEWVLTDPTALSDFFETIGMQGVGTDVAQLLRGEITLEDLVKERGEKILKAPVQKVANLVTPAIKAPAEVATGMEFFPDVFNLRYSRTKTEGGEKRTPTEQLGYKIIRSIGLSEISSSDDLEKLLRSWSRPPTQAITGISEIDQTRAAEAIRKEREEKRKRKEQP